MSLFVNLVCWLAISGILAAYTKKRITQIFPATYCSYMITLYILSFFRAMSYIDELSVFFAIIVTLVCWKKVEMNKIIKVYISYDFLWIVLTIIIGMILLWKRSVSAFDEFNFWAVDFKSMYYLDGLAGKGSNCALAYGDYPPGATISGWIIAHMAQRYGEAFSIIGLYIACMIFVGMLIGKYLNNVLTTVLAVPWAMFFSAFAVDIFATRSPDYVMGFCFGSILITTLEYIINKQRMDIFSLAIQLSFLTIIKSTGIEWAVFGIVVQLFYRKKIKKRAIVITSLTTLITYASWLIFCNVMNRSTYLVNNLITMQNGELPEELKNYVIPLLKSYVTTYLFKATSSMSLIYMTPFAITVLLVLGLYVYRKDDITAVFIKYTIFLIVTELLILLTSIETMFLGEGASYSNPDNMIYIYKRYGAPLWIGLLMVDSWMFFKWAENKINKNILMNCIIIVMIFFSLNKNLYDSYIGYHSEAYECITRGETINHNRSLEGEKIYYKVSEMVANISPAKRVMFATLSKDSSIQENFHYFSYYCAPVSTVQVTLAENFYEKEVIDLMNYYDCDIFCLMNSDDDAAPLQTIDNVIISNNKLYYIENDKLVE